MIDAYDLRRKAKPRENEMEHGKELKKRKKALNHSRVYGIVQHVPRRY
jgi:hypothetical protein